MWDQTLGTVPIADVAVTDTSVVVCAGSGRLAYWRFAWDGTLLAHEDHAQGWHPRTDGRTVLYSDGADPDPRFHAWVPGVGEDLPPGKPIGNNASGISPSGVQFYQRHGDASFPLGVYCGSVQVADYRPTGIWEAHDDGSVAMMDDCNRPAYAPGAGGYVHRCGPLMVGEGPAGGVQVWFEGLRHLLYGGTDTKWPRVSVHDDRVAVVLWGDAGTRLWVGTLNDVRALPLDIPAAPAHLTMCGYFFRDTGVHAYLAPYGGENPSAPGTHSIIVDDFGMPAEPHPDGHTPRMIVGAGQLIHGQIASWWDRIDAVYIIAETSRVAEVAKTADFARMLMRERGLSPKPLLSYTAGHVLPAALGPDDILGVQLYAERGADPVASIRAQAEAIWPQIQAVPRVAIIGQAYDRGGWFTGAQIAAIQPELYRVACAWSNCELLAWFSDARRGGTRDYEAEVRPWHQAIAEAIGRR